MGSSSSKAARTASKVSPSNAARKYPTRPSQGSTNVPPPRPTPEATARPTGRVKADPSSSRDQGINRDASDPDLLLNARMRKLGPVQPHPTLSSPSTQSQFQASPPNPEQQIYPSATQHANPAVSLLTARYRLAEEAEAEFANIGRSGGKGRQFLDVVSIMQLLMLRDEKGLDPVDIERRLGLRRGVVRSLGRPGVVGRAGL